jgi:hypothetical protein
MLGEFTEAYLDDKNAAHLTRRLTFRLLAEALYVKSKFHGALHFAYCYRSSQGSIRFTEERNKKMARFLLVQEAFILCHELSHWCFFRCNEDEKQNQIKFKRSLWSKYFDELIEARKIKSGPKGTSMLLQMRDKILNDDRIIEECVCDTFATMYLIEYFDGINEYSKIDIAIGSFLAIQNLQLLIYLEDDIYSASLANSSIELSFQMTLRMIIFKYHIHNYLYTYSRLDTEKYDQEIIACKELYDERIFNEFIGSMNNAQQEMLHLHLLPEITVLDDSWESIDLLIRNLLADN